jgi:hypothetical protein
LKINKELKNENKNENNNNNNNSISNTIIINKESTSKTSLEDNKFVHIKKSKTQEIIKTFKEYLLLTLIEYFKNEMILLNNIIELSKYIILKEDDLKKLIAILVTDSDDSRISLECELPDSFKTCQPCCSKIPIYKKITSIVIDNKHEFRNQYNSFYTQMQKEFNISLEFVLN